MHDLIIEAIARGGYFGIFVLMALENVFPPVPSEVIMGVGGVLVARGEMAFWPLMIWGTLGTTLGNYAWYWIGDKWGYERTRPFIDRWGRWLTIDWEHMEAATRFFQNHGQWVVFFLRFSPFLRTMISLPAGLAHMPLGRFLFFTFAGSAIWNALLVFGGTVLARWLEEYNGVMGWIVLGLVVMAIAAYAWRVATWKPRHLRTTTND
ncbi:Inner membrane protein YqjA [Tsuneonella dongtanensis]|uniref:Inner membrane protein YqjA n=1 Tax=Tsuneonella dongtanensis TaxID=692370 RepID=A0A1B2AFR6_9SPHN|nr:DedA family protein [Tsuneonella dongtanensis]ANY20875.1 Inner membrane protein YqjA [Tsuneonella dongtanensis]